MIEAATLLGTIKSIDPSLLVVDGRHFEANTFHSIKANLACPLLWIDDNGFKNDNPADLILNQNLYASESMYPNIQPDRLLLGSQWVLLRNEFRKIRPSPPIQKQTPLQLLITLGGADPKNATEKLIHLIHQIPEKNFTTHVVIGGSNPHKEALFQTFRDTQIEWLIAPKDMASILQNVDICISSAGSTINELLYLGIPSIIGSSISGEALMLDWLRNHGPFTVVGNWETLSLNELNRCLTNLLNSLERRQIIHKTAHCIVDAMGANRVIDKVCNLLT
jgi:spore coat polysaccharide biosynthesis predicted glycosyltransferase SpsG